MKEKHEKKTAQNVKMRNYLIKYVTCENVLVGIANLMKSFIIL